ncbi:TrmB family transcriptional regulator [Halapricum hydrolyticum]|uniref:TrmB family transcriptional regulator n=1 Tax=Halapricum hydrolyticum TaxID=2979991 RepID=A0AAE3LFP2_9EURY|nr:TrmB family transcriptional regulator [Halapricum hydrolyticum]MCU4727847.1 TrmB family transcriptional regulator [Halapricum hydrolyticum]
MDSERLVSVLQIGGLSRYQAQAYVALLELGTVSAGDLADASGVPQPRIYDVLRDLEADGYVETYEGETLQARVHDPGALVSDLSTRIAQFQSATDEIEHRWTEPEPTGQEAAIVAQFETVLTRTIAFIEDANNHVQLSVTPDQIEQLESTLRAAHEDGIHVQLAIHSFSEDDLPDEEYLAGLCTEARVRERPAAFLALIDQQQVGYALYVDSPSEYGMLIDDRGLAYVFSWFFSTMLWELWDTHYDGRSSDPPLRYFEIRRAIPEIEPLLEEGATVHVRITGQWVDSRRPCQLVGTVSEVTYEGKHLDEGPITLRDLVGKASLVVDTDGGAFSVGGMGTHLEDVEIDQIVVEEIAL